MTGRISRHWADMDERGLLWGMKFLVAVHRLCGRAVFRVFLFPVVAYYFLAKPSVRRASQDYLRRLGRRYPELGLSGGLRESLGHLLVFGETLLDKILAWTNQLPAEAVEFHNRHLLREMLEQGRGGVILGGHIGNLEVCRALAGARDHIQLTVLAHTKHAEKFNRLLRGVDGAGNVTLLQVTELNPAIGVLLREKIDRGEFLFLVGDRTPVGSHGRTVKAEFLGAPAHFPQGPYLLASWLRCPIFTLFGYPLEGRYQVFIDAFADSVELPRREPGRSQVLADLARRYAERLESHCRRAPLQWFNFHGFWDEPEKASRP